MAKDSIHSELLTENTKLRQMLDETLIATESLSSYTVQELEDKLRITGILIGPGTWKGVDYTPEEIKTMYTKYKPILDKLDFTLDHDENIRGHHINTEYDDTLKSIKYTAEIDEPEAVKLIRDGSHLASSMRSTFRPVFKNGRIVAKDIKPIHNTATDKPACKFSQVYTIQGLDEEDVDITYYGVHREGESLNDGDESMSNTEEKNTIEIDGVKYTKQPGFYYVKEGSEDMITATDFNKIQQQLEEGEKPTPNAGAGTQPDASKPVEGDKPVEGSKPVESEQPAQLPQGVAPTIQYIINAPAVPTVPTKTLEDVGVKVEDTPAKEESKPVDETPAKEETPKEEAPKEEKEEEAKPLNYSDVVSTITKDDTDPVGLAAELLISREKRKEW